jgi:hypothetical protein
MGFPPLLQFEFHTLSLYFLFLRPISCPEGCEKILGETDRRKSHRMRDG